MSDCARTAIAARSAADELAMTLNEDFKGAMRHLASSVSIISSGQGERRRGLTATAVCSLSVSPPMLLICVNQFGEAHQAIIDSGAFCVNVLSAEDNELSDRFAGQTGCGGESRFQSSIWSQLLTGSPALDCALVNIDCRLAQVINTATHSVFFGDVASVRVNKPGVPLIHFNRQYRSLSAQA
ncbi:flavin reductase family protein [Acerihabitans sp. TG2]|uniref:flavin reductase family protein n=1 Tax=Acerihabitans sp. TG2 TaxID=3096008 RepID=UPI002B234559|nr:flavin reductase family protein [Acerihabitans sp. TG2]MEA9391257.1 flavin reductase family protein [Acerihabitans sp. TG2]